MLKRKHTYTVWAMPTDHVARRIKKVMEKLREEFGGPEIEPHITVVGSVFMTEEKAVEQFYLGCENIASYNCKVIDVASRKFFYQSVSLLIDPDNEVSRHDGLFINFERGSPHMPHLSLLYAKLTEEERERAEEKVLALDESICSLNIQINRLVLYKTNNEARDQTSWEKVLEHNLPLRRPDP